MVEPPAIVTTLYQDLSLHNQGMTDLSANESEIMTSNHMAKAQVNFLDDKGCAFLQTPARFLIWFQDAPSRQQRSDCRSI